MTKTVGTAIVWTLVCGILGIYIFLFGGGHPPGQILLFPLAIIVWPAGIGIIAAVAYVIRVFGAKREDNEG